MPDVHMRLVLYKRIASASNEKELKDIQIELIDRFGLLPDASKNLIATTELKLFANGLGINKIEAHEDGGRIIFAADPNIDIDQLLGLIQLEPNVFKMNGSEKLSFNVHLEDVDSRINYIRHLINTILVKS